MTLETLRLYCDVINAGSFSKGAREHRISQSAASQSIKQLEEELKVTLIDRSKRPFMITDAGQLFFGACKDLLAGFDKTKALLKVEKESVGGDVRIAVIYSVGLQYMGWYNSQFTARYPSARIRMSYLHPQAVIDAVIHDKAEIGILSFATPHRSLEIIPWQFEPLVLVCHRSHPLARRRLVQAKELAGEKVVGFDPSLGIRKAIDKAFRQRGVRLNTVMEFDNIETIKEAVAIQSGVGILPRPAVAREVEFGALAAVQLDIPELVRQIDIIHRKQRQLPAAAKRFLDLIKEIGDRDSR